MKRKPNDTVRIWSTGCSTGEEAYSIAILFNEFARKEKLSLKIRIFATDINRKVLRHSEKGVYSAEAFDEIKFGLLNRYFTKNSDNYMIDSEIRNMVEFSYYDLLDKKSYAPSESIFGDFDIVLCRNVLIYFTPNFQNIIFEKLLKAMKDNAVLVLLRHNSTVLQVDLLAEDTNDAEIENSIQNVLNQYINHYPSYHELFILNPDNGKVILSTNKLSVGAEYLENELFTKPLSTKGFFIKDIHYSEHMRANSMTFTIPLAKNDVNKKIIGVLVARIDLQNSLYKQLKNRVGLGSSGETLIVNSEGIALNDLRWYENAPLNQHIVAEPAVNAASGETGITESDDYRGVKVLAAFTHIPETNWGFVCKEDLSEVNEPIRDMLINFLILFIIFAVIIIVIAMVISGSITLPITNMSEVAKLISGGDLSARNNEGRNDELGFLARTYNSMAESVSLRLKTQQGVADVADSMIKENSLNGFCYVT